MPTIHAGQGANAMIILPHCRAKAIADHQMTHKALGPDSAVPGLSETDTLCALAAGACAILRRIAALPPSRAGPSCGLAPCRGRHCREPRT